jgi:tricorn protease interacting factor F2/3
MDDSMPTHETLGNTAVPYHYKILFEVNLKSFLFKGSETIFALVAPNTQAISLNSKELKITKANIESAGVTQTASVSEDKKNERITLKVNKPVSGICKINLEFEGANNDRMYGFYRAKYNYKGKDEYLLTTQFESTDARAAFPCFDEPSMKATFSISAIADSKYQVISNMPVKEIEKLRGKRKFSFHLTPKMSTYLVYIGVGRFEYYLEQYRDVKIQAVTVPGRKEQGILASQYAKKSLEFYENYFGIKYMLPKLDLIAIPDFAAGAMENWGAITFRETAMLLDKKRSSISSRQNVADTVAHEIAHQWFGDLVTMKWWDDLWLNESFATFMSYKAVDSIFPEWKFMVQYLNDTFSSAFTADELKSTHPINVEVHNPGEIEEVFDNISYEKGGSVLSMIEDFVGPEIFRSGLNIYLNKHMYGNAAKEDLWEAINAAAERASKHMPIDRFAKFWIDTPGYPIVTVSKSKEGFELKQSRFLLSGSSKWSPAPIPVHYVTDKGKSGMVLLDSPKEIIKMKGAKWIKVNYGQKGFYRAAYSKELLPHIGEAIKSGKLDSKDAWGVENDLFELARRGSIKAAAYLDFVGKYFTGVGYPANVSIILHLNWLRMMLYGTKLQENADNAIKLICGFWLNKLGWEKRKNDTNLDIMLRSYVISALGRIGDENVSGRCKSLFSKGKDKIDPDIRSAVYTTIAWNGGIEEFNKIIKLYNLEKVPEEKIRLLQSLAFFNYKGSAEKVLGFSQSKYVRLQDSIFIPVLLSSNPAMKSEYWPWLKSNWKALMAKYTGVSRMLSRLVEATSTCSTQKQLSDITAFFSKKSNVRDDIKRSILKAEERIEANIRFLKINMPGH